MRVKETNLPPLHLCASNDDLRPALQHILIKEGIAYASDAHMVVVSNLRKGFGLSGQDIDKLNGKLFTKDAWSLIHNAVILDVNETGVVIKKKSLVAEIKHICAEDINPPDYQKAIKSNFDKGKDEDSRVSVNPRYLELSRRVIGTDHLIVEVYKNGGHFCFDPSIDNVFCLIMGKVLDPLNMDNRFSLDFFL